ncbi:MAG: hypothetical protein PHU42_01005 [Patescibacteria group bacterium]|nr:hypothetical protein [Patescibacteria group bacterium]
MTGSTLTVEIGNKVTLKKDLIELEDIDGTDQTVEKERYPKGTVFQIVKGPFMAGNFFGKVVKGDQLGQVQYSIHPDHIESVIE